MTKPQEAKYWREWGAVSRACKARGIPVPDRHELHVKALGVDKSHKDFTNDDCTDIFAEFTAISDPDNLAAQVRFATMRCTNRIYSIKRLAPEAYWRAEARRKFGTDALETLRLEQLTMLRNHLTARRGDEWREAVEKAPANLQPVAAGQDDPHWSIL